MSRKQSSTGGSECVACSNSLSFLSATFEVVFYFLEVDMQTPIHPLVADMVGKLHPALREAFEERAAILEFEAAMLRDHAECLASAPASRGFAGERLNTHFASAGILYEVPFQTINTKE